MALTARKSKGVRKGRNRAATKSLDQRIIGDEPLIVDETNYTMALNWYNYTFDVDKAREILLTYLKNNKAAKSDITFMRRCPKDRILTTAAWQAQMMMNGNKLTEQSQAYFDDRIKQMIAFGKETKEEIVVVKADKPNIQERTFQKNSLIFAECEAEVIDQRGSVYDFLTRNEATPSAAQFIRAKYEPIYEEVMSDDPEIEEGFGKQLKAERKYWQVVMDELDRYIGNKKAVKVRKPRAKKVKAAIDVVKKLKYQKEDPSLKIVSVNPAEVVGAQQLWTYNTKYKKLSVFNAMGPSGITVKGTTLIGFDDKQSVSKRLRKPETALSDVLSAGKVTLRKFMDTLTTSASIPNGRINSDTILLRVIK